MRIPGKCKLKGSEKKIILRETAASMGLPERIAFRKKLAAPNYGTGVRIISEDTREGIQLRELGGIAAILRYEVYE